MKEIAQKLSEEQRRADETKAKLEQREKELLEKLDADTQTINSLEEKINTVSNKSSDESLPLEALDVNFIKKMYILFYTYIYAFYF